MHVFMARLIGSEPLRAADGEGGGSGLSISAASDAIAALGNTDAPADDGGDQAADDVDDQGGAEAGDADEQDPAAPSPGEDDADGAEGPGEGDEGREEPEPGRPAVKAPAWWNAEEQAQFANASPELQAIIAAAEGRRESATSKAKQESAEARNAYTATTTQLRQLTETLAAVVPDEEKAFADRWADVDWQAVVQKFGADQAMQYQLQRDEERAALDAKKDALAKAQASLTETEANEYAAFLTEEMGKLAEVSPDLADPKLGAERRGKVAKFLQDLGVPPEQIRHAGATEFALAYDAMRYRQAKATAGKRPAPPKPNSQPARPQVRPGAAQTASSQQRRRSEVEGRFHAKPSLDNAVAALLSRK